MKTSVIGYPRIGANRELKFACEKYFRGEIGGDALQAAAASLRSEHWRAQKARGIDWIASNDFSLYDGVLDTAVLFNIVPERIRALGLSPLDTYFAMARGYQGERGDVKALPMKKWYNTNYHYLVPEWDDSVAVRFVGTKLTDEFTEAARQGIRTKPVLIGPFTLLKLSGFPGSRRAEDVADNLATAYADALKALDAAGAEWIQFDEPELVKDLSLDDLALFTRLYQRILPVKGGLKALVQTYFGDVREAYATLCGLPFDGIGLDFVEGRASLSLVRQHGFPADQTLFAGVVNGKNIWRNRYRDTIRLARELRKYTEHLVLSTSCSLLHVPYSLREETNLLEEQKRHFAFAEEKLQELSELSEVLQYAEPESASCFLRNEELFSGVRYAGNESVQAQIAALTESDFTRLPVFAERQAAQKDKFRLPPLPTTTIGSFPQTADVRANRRALKTGAITEQQYNQFVFGKIEECVARQEELGLDVLVHGEFERNDMVEYFGERLDGFLFTNRGWVQSYGTRCVKPPVLWGDISRSGPITVEWSVYANRLTPKPVKGMLTGPVTILNWSFPREDMALRASAFQLALAIREEVLDLEANGIEIIQIDEAALREKLPLRTSDWRADYLSWAIPAFRLTHSGVKAETQIHTHMCYSQFSDILGDIDDMDADVVTFEASRSDLSILESIRQCGFRTEVGPGVYDIHSPRVPGTDEMKEALLRMLDDIDAGKLWVNPDCGLKTRGEAETWASLAQMVQAAADVRRSLQLHAAARV